MDRYLETSNLGPDATACRMYMQVNSVQLQHFS